MLAKDRGNILNAKIKDVIININQPKELTMRYLLILSMLIAMPVYGYENNDPQPQPTSRGTDTTTGR